ITAEVGTDTERYVTKLYETLFGHGADPNGLQFWTNLLDQGTPRIQVVTAMSRSPEAQAFQVQQAFQTFLGRDATDSEVSDTIATTSRSSINVEGAVLGSQAYFNESGGGTVSGYLSALASDVLGTTFSPAVEAALTSQIQRGTPLVEIAKEVLTSQSGK